MSAIETFAGWESLPPLPSPNGGFACGVLRGNVVVLGGTNWKDDTKQWLDVIWAYDAQARQWEVRGKLPHPLAYAVTGEWNGELIVAGGTDGRQARKEVWRIGPSLELTPSSQLREDSVLASGDVVGESLFILGGCADAAKLDGLHKGGERLDLPTGKVGVLAPAGDCAFGLAASLGIGRELFVFGGVRPDLDKKYVSLSAAWAFDAGKGAWRALKPYPMPVHGSSAVKLDEHRILIAGGYGGNPPDFTAAAFIYDARRDTYTRTMDLPGAAMAGLVRAADFVYCLGGENTKRRTAACARVTVAELLRAGGMD